MLGGYLIAYLNLDEVIKIIRNEDEPKPVLMKTFKLTDVQAEAILNMRLRNLRKLEEMEIRNEDKDAARRAQGAQGLLGSEKEQWKTIADEIKEVREKFGPKTPLGKRRTTFAQAPEHDEAAIEEAMVEREPITVVVSEKGWIRALRGHVTDLSGIAFKADDGLKFAFLAETTSKMPDVRAPTAASTRSTPSSCRAGAATASRCGCSSISSRSRPRHGVPPIRAGASSWSRAIRAGASWSPRTSASPTPARASRCSTSRRPTRRAR